MPKRTKSKIKEWFNRYFLPSVLGIATAIIAGNIVKAISGNIILAAFIATWLDTIVFYGIIGYRDLKKRKNKEAKLTFIGFLKVLRNMIIEFGPAEYLDTLLIRPFFLAILPYFMSNYSLAVLIGSICAEIIYYVPTIIMYELRKKVFKD